MPDTNELRDTAQALYERMAAEMDTLTQRLETMSAKDVMQNAYELVIKRDLLMLMEETEFTTTQLKALESMDYPLDAIYQNWVCSDVSYMDQLREHVEEFADNVMRVKAMRRCSNPAVPPYEKGMAPSMIDASMKKLVGMEQERDGQQHPRHNKHRDGRER